MNLYLKALPILLACPLAMAGEFFDHPQSAKAAGRYMVVLEKAPGYSLEKVGTEVAKFLGNRRVAVTDVWNDALNGFLIENVTEATAKELSAVPGVLFVEADTIGVSSSTQTNPPAGLDLIDQKTLTLNHSYVYNYTGSNVHVYVLDDGIRTTHVDLGGRATSEVDCFSLPSCTPNPTFSGGTHGSAVAGIIGGSVHGVAKGVHLHSIRINELESFTASNLVKGLNWLAQHAIHPAVANMSVNLYSPSAAISSATYGASATGILLIASAGNNQSPDDNTYLNACNNSPAGAQGVLVVSGDSPSLGLGPCVFMFAPSHADTISGSSDTAPAALDRSSAAAPHVTGVAALILQQYPTLSPEQVGWELAARSTAGMLTHTPNLHGAPDRFVYSLPVYSTLPTPPTSLSVGAANCSTGISHLVWTGGGVYTYAEVQRSASSTFTPPDGIAYRGPARTFDVVNVIPTTYYRVRNCNSIGCSAYTNGNQPATLCGS